MTKLPRLKIIGLGWDAARKFHDFSQARHLPFGQDLIIMVEDRVVWSYEDMVELAALDDFKDKEFLEVKILPVIMGG